MSSVPELNEQIISLGSLIRQLKLEKADPESIGVQVKALQALKASLATLSGVPTPNPHAATASKKPTKFVLKTPKGTKDWHPTDMLLRQTIFRKITDVFEGHGGVTIDTPVFELKEILSGKYGEDSKLIYDLQDQGGELCSLRYDLTVPFARFLAMNGSTYPTIKRYHIAKVYRRDQPVMTKGRMREFYQCDFDVAGIYEAMLPDAECIAVACEVLESLDIGDFTIKMNHRKILDGIFEVCGVPLDKTRTISSAVDKLDKMSWLDVRREMIVEKGLEAEVADRIGEYVRLKGGEDLLAQLQQDTRLVANATAKAGLADMALLFQYLDMFGITARVSFDLSLARGLDYYTGIIYEAVTEGSAPPTLSTLPGPTESVAVPTKAKKAKAGEEPEVDESTIGVGSIAAGGRYDDLVGMFSGNAKIPCVGISFGVERLFSLLLAKAKAEGKENEGRSKKTEVYVVSIGEGLLRERIEICKELWSAGIKAEFMFKTKPKLAKQFETIDKERIPFAVLVAPDELKQGKIRVKAQVGKDEAGGGQGELVDRSDLVSYLKKLLVGQE